MEKDKSTNQRYQSSTLRGMYDAYKQEFDKKGDCYDEYLKIIEKGEDEEGNKLDPDTIRITKMVLKHVYIDFCVANKTTVISEEDYIKD
jgi:hypothetical protein